MISFSHGIQQEYSMISGNTRGAVQKYCNGNSFDYLSELTVDNLTIAPLGVGNTNILYQGTANINENSESGKYYYTFNSEGNTPRITMKFKKPVKISALCFMGVLGTGATTSWYNDYCVTIFVRPFEDQNNQIEYSPPLFSVPSAGFDKRFAVFEAPVTNEIEVKFTKFCSYQMYTDGSDPYNYGSVHDYAYKKGTTDFVLFDLFPIFYENNPVIDETKIKSISTYDNLDVFSGTMPVGECKAKIIDGDKFVAQLNMSPCSLWEDNRFLNVYYVDDFKRDKDNLFDVRFTDIKGVLSDLTPDKNMSVFPSASNTFAQVNYSTYVDSLIFSSGIFNLFLTNAHEYDRKTVIDNIEMILNFDQIIQTAFLAEDSIGKMLSDISFSSGKYLACKGCANLTFFSWADNIINNPIYSITDDLILGNPVYNASNAYDYVSGNALKYMVSYVSNFVLIQPYIEAHVESVSLADASPIQVNSTGEITNVEYEGDLPSGYSASFTPYSLTITHGNTVSQSSVDFTIYSLDPHYFSFSVYKDTVNKTSKKAMDLNEKRASMVAYEIYTEPLLKMLISSTGEIDFTLIDIEELGYPISMGMIMSVNIPQEGLKYGLVIGLERIFSSYRNTINIKLKEIPASALEEYKNHFN